jgi:ATP-dependent RNA helicase DDX27
MAADDFIMTIDSDDDERLPPKGLRYAASQNLDPEDAQLDAEFTFDLNGDPYTDIIGEFHSRDLVKTGSRPVSTFMSTYNAPIHQFFTV